MERYWSRFADEFDAKQAYVAGEELIQSVHAKLAQQKNLGTLLEFGCGNGNYTRTVTRESDSVTATDYSREMVNKTREAFAHTGSVHVEKADCHHTRYADNSFDTVFMANLIHIINDPDAVIREARRLLKPGGRLIVTSFAAKNMSFVNKVGLLIRYLSTFGMFPKSKTDFTIRSLSTLLESEGFQITEATLLGRKTHSLFLVATKPKSFDD